MYPSADTRRTPYPVRRPSADAARPTDPGRASHFCKNAVRGAGKQAPTFSFGLGELAPELCELRFAQALVERDRLVNHVALMEPAWVAAKLGTVIRTLEEPPLGLPAIAQYRIFERCAEAGVRVILDGEGSDEILGGYPYNQRALLIKGSLLFKPNIVVTSVPFHLRR